MHLLASSGLPLKSLSQSSPFRRVCSDTTPFIAVLIEAATGADMRPYSVDARYIYARNDMKEASHTYVAGLSSLHSLEAAWQSLARESGLLAPGSPWPSPPSQDSNVSMPQA